MPEENLLKHIGIQPSALVTRRWAPFLLGAALVVVTVAAELLLQSIFGAFAPFLLYPNCGITCW